MMPDVEEAIPKITPPVLSFRDIVGHDGALRLLGSLLRRDAFPQALRFVGEAGTGKSTVARILATTLFCPNARRSDPIQPCNQCPACVKMAHGTHPDFLHLVPETVSKPDGREVEGPIKIDAIRDMQARLVFRPIEAERRIVLIDPADAMNEAAANGLLKTLEEPPAYVLLILIVSRPDVLPETLHSRCQKVAFHAPAFSQVEALVRQRRGYDVADARLVTAMAGGRIGEALSLSVEAARTQETALHALVSDDTLTHNDALLALAKHQTESEARMRQGLYYLSAWFRDVLVFQSVVGGVDPSWLVYTWRHDEIQQWAERADAHAAARFLARVQEIQRGEARNLNRQLAMETLLLTLQALRETACPAQG